MDKGAHFYKCDFQVHTPRDRQWSGSEVVTDEERKQYAERFVLACRRKGLHAVAITDHHDTAFVSYIKVAAVSERRDDGTPIPEEEQLVVFPGIELTLGVPCQAILLLDSDFPLNQLTNVTTILGVSEASVVEAKTCQTQRLSAFHSLLGLCEELDRHSHLRGRYCLLPNVSEGGNATLLRSGFQGKYREMTCVGGYLDGPLSQLGRGNLDIINGRNRDYGFKSIGVFQTSDNRSDDFANLAEHVSWVKWAQPTAEAIRQACLAKDTRIKHTEPVLPSIVIQSLEVSNSKFMGPIDLHFNAEFNCLIGGRGTGKSTILEYLRWGLCDQPPLSSAIDDLPDYQAKRQALIENTLAPLESVVTVVFLLNGVPHALRRNLRTKEVLLRIGTEEFQLTTVENARQLLPIQAYSQKQLSAVSVREEELLRFVRMPVQEELARFAQTEVALTERIRVSYGQLRNKRTAEREVKRLNVELRSLDSRLQSLRAQLTGLSDDDTKVLKVHDAYLQERAAIGDVDVKLKRLRDLADAFAQQLSTIVLTARPLGPTPNASLVAEYQRVAIGLVETALAQARSLSEVVAVDGSEPQKMADVKRRWQSEYDSHDVAYEAAKDRATQHKSRLQEIAEIEQRVSIMQMNLAELGETIAGLGMPEEEFRVTRGDWCALYRKRADLLSEKCQELTRQSHGRIRAVLLRGHGLKQVGERLEAMLTGTRVRAKKIEDLCGRFAHSENTVEEWQRVLDEFELLADVGRAEGEEVELPATPLLSAAGFGPTELAKIAQTLTVEKWLELALTPLEDVPVFEYQLREGEYIKFADASAGQQATALLRVLLSQKGPPLIIDQPEEDLDNQVISEIVENIWTAKPNRQLIFTSHNANIVVNGDADLVVCCDYRRAGDQSGGQIKRQGAIDVAEVRKEITTVMEGGVEAFALRKAKYGF